MGEPTRTTTTTTTRTVTTTTTISINMTYLKWQGVLKIIEIIVCIIQFALIADIRGASVVAVALTGTTGYSQGPTFAMAIGIIFFLTTLILLIFFLFNIVEKLGGAKIWFIIDMVLNILAVILFFIAFIVLCVYCSYTYTTWGNTFTVVISYLVVAAIFSLIAMVLYIVSIILSMKAGQTPMIEVKA